MNEHQENFGRNRRQQARYPVNLTARLHGRARQTFSCRICDLSTTGLLIDLGRLGAQIGLERGEYCRLRFELPAATELAKEKESIQAILELIYHHEHRIGGRFAHLVSDGTQRLTSFLTRVVSTNEVSAKSVSEREQTRARIILWSLAQEDLALRLDLLFQKLVKVLFKRNGELPNGVERVKLLQDTLRIVSAIRTERVYQQLKDTLAYALTKPDLGLPETDSNALIILPTSYSKSIIIPDSTEILLLKSQLIQAIESSLQTILPVLRSQTALLFDNETLPIEPEGVIEICTRILSAMRISSETLTQALKILSESLPDILDIFYQNVFTNWITAGLSVELPQVLQSRLQTQSLSEAEVIPVNDDSSVNQINQINQINRLQQSKIFINQALIRDPNTGLPNILALHHLLNQCIKSNSEPLIYTIGFLIIEGLSFALARAGRMVGEQILQAVVSFLPSQLPEPNYLAIGEQQRFTWLTLTQDRTQAMQLGEKIRIALQQTEFPESGHFTASIGLVLATVDDHAEDILAAAELASLAAHEQGGNRVVWFNKEDSRIRNYLALVRLWTEMDLGRKQKFLRLRCQKIIALDPDSTQLIRGLIEFALYDDENLPLPLDNFIASAEVLNLRWTLDHYRIEAALSWFNQHPEITAGFTEIILPLCTQSLQNPDLINNLRDTFTQYDQLPYKIGLQFSETALSADFTWMLNVCRALHDLGCNLWLADFGAHAAANEYLRRIPLNGVQIAAPILKIAERDLAVQEHLIPLIKQAHQLKLHVIAGEISCQELLPKLRQFGLTEVRCSNLAAPFWLN